MYFTIRMQERNGEQEYAYNFLIKASNIKEAAEKADYHAKTWYTDPNVVYNVETNEYEFFGGSLTVGYNGPNRTTKKEFINILSNQYIIK